MNVDDMFKKNWIKGKLSYGIGNSRLNKYQNENKNFTSTTIRSDIEKKRLKIRYTVQLNLKYLHCYYTTSLSIWTTANNLPVPCHFSHGHLLIFFPEFH